MRILGIETSCDETGASVVKDGRKVLSNVISSSVELHKKYGGVVPEVAAREQVRVIIPAIDQALDRAKLTPKQIDAISVTVGPGLIGSLLVGCETAKTLGLVLGKPVIPVNHLVGHIYANWLETSISHMAYRKSQKTISNKPIAISNDWPKIGLVVSGGHTDLVLMKNHGKFNWLGGTRDDAAGEAFDKIARVLGLGYPGGPEIEHVARNFKYQMSNVKLPRPMIAENNFDFSFSGLKTAVVNLVNSKQITGNNKQEVANIAASFQEAIVEVLVTKTIKAAKNYKARQILLGGGVAANQLLRDKMVNACNKIGTSVKFPPVELCIDNGAMIASAAFYNFKPESFEKIQAEPGLHF